MAGPRPRRLASIYTSPRIEKLLGYSAEEWNTSDAWKDRLHPHDRERVLAATARSETTGEPFSEEYRVFAKDGRLVVVFDHATLLSRDDQGRPLLFQGVLMDMTDQHRAQAFAERSAQRYREITEDGPVVFSVLEVDPDAELDPGRGFRLRYLSPQIQDILGYPAARFYADVCELASASSIPTISPRPKRPVSASPRGNRGTSTTG